jgi:hypothetical protein
MILSSARCISIISLLPFCPQTLIGDRPVNLPFLTFVPAQASATLSPSSCGYENEAENSDTAGGLAFICLQIWEVREGEKEVWCEMLPFEWTL